MAPTSEIYEQFGINFDRLLRQLPCINADRIEPCSEPVSTVNIQDWANDAASKLASALESRSVIVEDLADEKKRALSDGIRHFVVSQVLAAMGRTDLSYTQAWERWNQVYAEYTNAPNRQLSVPSKVSGLTGKCSTKDDWFTDGESF